MKWLLDTDVLSQPAKKLGDKRVVAWIEQEQSNCYTSAIVIAQLAYWVRSKNGNARRLLEQWLSHLVNALEGRIYSFNVSIAHTWADQRYLLEQAGKPMPLEESLIAATARKHNLIIATGNEKDFCQPGLKIFNPFKISEREFV
ncbi:MAG: PIN domain-containing protein [Chthoniobacterales bacterium]